MVSDLHGILKSSVVRNKGWGKTGAQSLKWNAVIQDKLRTSVGNQYYIGHSLEVTSAAAKAEKETLNNLYCQKKGGNSPPFLFQMFTSNYCTDKL